MPTTRSQQEQELSRGTGLEDTDRLSKSSYLTRTLDRLRRLPRFTLLLAGAITLPVSAAIALDPAHHDGATFIYMGEMWAKGIIPYVQLFDNKPPGIFALIAVAAHTPNTIWTVALIEFLFVMCCIFTVRRMLQRCGCPKNAVFLGTLGMALMANLYAYAPGNISETYMLWPMTASMLAFFKAIRSRKIGDVFLAGLFSGVACMFKPFGLSALIAQIAFTNVWSTSKESNRLSWTAANLLGALTAWIPALAYFSVHHGLKQMLDASFLYNAHYGLASKPFALTTLSMVAERLLPVSSTVVCLAVGLVWLRRYAPNIPSDRRSPWILTLLWFGAGLCLVLAAGRGYTHYFTTLTPALGLAAALFFWSVEEGEGTGEIRLAIGALIIGPVFLAYVPGLVKSVHGFRDVVLHRRKEIPVDTAARELQRISTPSNTLLVWGYEPWLFSSTHLRSALRYPTTQYIYDSPRSYAAVGSEILGGMQVTPPDFVVVTPWEYSPPWLHQSDPVQEKFKRILQSSYAEVWQADSFTIYRRR
jgi:hypothetical protein